MVNIFADEHQTLQNNNEAIRGIFKCTAKLNTAQACNANNEIFSVATLIYTRLRRISGRVIDVMYLVENSVLCTCMWLQLAFATQDDELCRLCARLNSILANLMDADAEITVATD